MSDLQLWKGTSLPDDLVTQKVACIGRSGSGKTYCANVLAEQLLRAGHQVLILDWVGNWRGLRLNTRGTGASGLGIYILGGEHGDLPIESGAGELIARTLVHHKSSAIIDVSAFRKGKAMTFATDFVESLLFEKKRQPSPVMFIVEEAQRFIPQKASRGSERMLGAFEEYAKVGRNRGGGLCVVTQRPQSVHKDVLNQTELLLTFQLNAAHERRAVKEWVAEQGMDADMLAMLPKLKPGEAIAWSPMWLDFLGKVKIIKRTTFDATKTPTLGDQPLGEVAPIDLSALETAMSDLVERKKANDPKELRAKNELLIAENERLQKDNLDLGNILSEDAEVEGARITALEEENKGLRVRFNNVLSVVHTVRATITDVEPLLDPKMVTSDVPTNGARSRADRLRAERAVATATPIDPNSAEWREILGPSKFGRVAKPRVAAAPPELADLGRGAARAVFEALAFWYPRRLSRPRLAHHAGISPRSSTMRGALAVLRKTPYLDESGEGFGLSEEGVTAAGSLVEQRPKRPAEVLDFWAGKFGDNATGRVFRVLREVERGGIERDALARVAGISPGSSTMRGALAELRSCDLLDESSSSWTLPKELLS